MMLRTEERVRARTLEIIEAGKHVPAQNTLLLANIQALLEELVSFAEEPRE